MPNLSGEAAIEDKSDAICGRLGTVNEVLNEEEYRQLSSSNGIQERIKKIDREAPCLFLEVKLEYDGHEHTQLYLRGFEGKKQGHLEVANDFLREVRLRLAEYFTNFPDTWQLTKDKPRESLVVEGDAFKLIITGIGGAIYEIHKGRIAAYYNIYYDTESKGSFGEVLDDYIGKLNEKLSLLVAKGPYKGMNYELMDFSIKKAQ